jgi:hypothetical protein
VGNKTIYLYAFEKSDQGSITNKEKAALQELGNFYLSLDDKELEERLSSGAIFEVKEEENGW